MSILHLSSTRVRATVVGVVAAASLGVGGLAGTAEARVAGPQDGAGSTLARGADTDCEVYYEGVDRTTGALVGRDLLDGVLVEEQQTSMRFPRNTVGRGFVGWSRNKRVVVRWYHVLREDGRARVYKQVVRRSDASLKDVVVVRGRTNDFTPRTYTSNHGFHIFAGEANGVLNRWTNYRDSSGREYYGGRLRLLPRGTDKLDALTYVRTTRIDGIRNHVLLAVTHGGALVRITVPVLHPRRTRLAVVEPTGFEGVTELSYGGCASSAKRVPVVASLPDTDTALWAEIPNIKRNLRATEPTVVADSSGWDVFDGVF